MYVKGGVSVLWRFLATESSWILMKILLLFHLKNSFRSQVFKFLSWLFGHAKETVSLEREG